MSKNKYFRDRGFFSRQDAELSPNGLRDGNSLAICHLLITASAMTNYNLESLEMPVLTGWSDFGTVTELMRFIFPPNLTGLPAISFPVGYNENGLPIGMQAIGRPWDEHVLLRVAYAAEQSVERKRPQVFFEILD